jgi:beta-xylosidase
LLLLPVDWTADGWFRVKPEIAADSEIPMPMAGSSQGAFQDPSDRFSAPELGLQWGFWHEYDPKRFQTGNGVLRLLAQGKSLEDSSVLTTTAGGHSYTIEADVEIEPGCEAGLLLFYNPEHAVGITLSPEGLKVRLANGYIPSERDRVTTRATLRIVNDDQEVDFYSQLPGQPWQRTEWSAEISGMHHNVLGGFLDVRPALCAWGSGAAFFRSFRYWPGVKLPGEA